MSGPAASAAAYPPMPQAPTAHVPSGLNAHAAARAAWAPNVFTWVLVWRVLLATELAIVTLGGVASGSRAALVAALVWTLASVVPAAIAQLRGRLLRSVLVVDLAACIALVSLARDDIALSILAAYACSTAISWAAHRPVDAFVAGGACSIAFVAIMVVSDITRQPAAITGTLSLFLFFSLATAGFFTVAHRIGALEIAGEIGRERGRYRRDLHDRLGQALSGMHFEVQAVQASGLDEHASGRLASLADGYADAQRMLRDLLSISDEPMVGTNVASVIREEARRMGQQTGVRITVETTGDASRVPPWMRPHIVAVAGECVNNAVKNGRAMGIDVTLDVTDDLLVLSITDDGVGFDNPAGTITVKDGHYGLREMAERARLCGGEVVIASQVGFGTRVRLQAPIPVDASQDVLERDASKLRENVWSLLVALRVVLGTIAVAQLLVIAARDAASAAALAFAALIVADVGGGAILSRSIHRRLQQSAAPAIAYCILAAAAYGAAVLVALPPAILLYAPLVLLGVGVASQRRAAARASWVMLGAVAAVTLMLRVLGQLSDEQLHGALVHVTDIALLGMAAVQGAKLLDRLEALQIRVRFQALARLRHGLSSRMRDQLTERLEQLERHTRMLAQQTPSNDEEFARATQQLTLESTQLKQRLREIVHTLADPTPPGRTPAHV